MLSRYPRAIAVACALVPMLTSIAFPAVASAAPRLTLTTTTWTAPGGCTQTIQHPEVTGVSGDAKTVIDQALIQTMIGSALPQLFQEKDDLASGCSGRDRGTSRGQVWTTGLATGHWLSVRLHQFVHGGGGAPIDAYTSMTFAVRDSLGPAPTDRFYSSATRPAFDAAIAGRYPQASTAQHEAYLSLNVSNTQIFVTNAGIEISNVDESAHANALVKLPNDALRGTYTPGGPLDPASR